MPNTYTWNCATVDAYPTHTDENEVTESQVVYNVHWRVTGSDEIHSASSIGTQTLATDDLSGFTAFDSVTHEDMITWTKAAMGEERVTEMEASLDSQIAELAAPSSVTLTIAEPVSEETPAE